MLFSFWVYWPMTCYIQITILYTHFFPALPLSQFTYFIPFFLSFLTLFFFDAHCKVRVWFTYINKNMMKKKTTLSSCIWFSSKLQSVARHFYLYETIYDTTKFAIFLSFRLLFILLEESQRLDIVSARLYCIYLLKINNRTTIYL